MYCGFCVPSEVGLQVVLSSFYQITPHNQTSDLKRFLKSNCRSKIMVIVSIQANNKNMAELVHLLLLVLFISHVMRKNKNNHM